MASMLDRSFVGAANHVLAGADWATTRLRPHIGKQACVRIGAWSMHVRVGSEGLLEPGDREAISDVTLGMPPQAAARWLVEREAAIRTVQVTGDADFAEALSFVAANVRWDFEEDLSRVTGDAVANRFGELVRAFGRWRREAAASVRANIAEYLTEEKAVLPTRLQAEAFLEAVDEVRDAAERLDKRIARLEARGKH